MPVAQALVYTAEAVGKRERVRYGMFLTAKASLSNLLAVVEEAVKRLFTFWLRSGQTFCTDWHEQYPLCASDVMNMRAGRLNGRISMSGRLAGLRSDRRQQNRFPHRTARAVAEMLEPRILMAADPIINEFLASNNRTNIHEDGDPSDWIEIYNPNSTSISLNGYFLTDKQSDLTEWKFPSVSLTGKGYLLVWASGKDRTDPARPLHTNFKLADEGEYLGLVDPDGMTIASDFGSAFPAQTADVSYGVPPAGGSDTYLMPTPGAANELPPP